MLVGYLDRKGEVRFLRAGASSRVYLYNHHSGNTSNQDIAPLFVLLLSFEPLDLAQGLGIQRPRAVAWVMNVSNPFEAEANVGALINRIIGFAGILRNRKKYIGNSRGPQSHGSFPKVSAAQAIGGCRMSMPVVCTWS